MKGVACSDKPTEDHHPTVQFPFSSTEPFSIFQVMVLVLRSQLYCFGALSLPTQFPASAGSCFQWKRSDKPTESKLHNSSVVERLAAKGPDISIELEETKSEIEGEWNWTYILQVIKTRLQINASVNAFLLSQIIVNVSTHDNNMYFAFAFCGTAKSYISIFKATFWKFPTLMPPSGHIKTDTVANSNAQPSTLWTQSLRVSFFMFISQNVMGPHWENKNALKHDLSDLVTSIYTHTL